MRKTFGEVLTRMVRSCWRVYGGKAMYGIEDEWRRDGAIGSVVVTTRARFGIS